MNRLDITGSFSIKAYIRNRLHQARVLLSVYYAWMLEYRAELFFWAVSMALPLIVMGVWVQASQNAPERFGLTSVEFARYFIAVFIVRNMSVVWVIHEFEQDIINGRLAPRLLQPLNPLWRYIAAHLGEQFARLPLAACLIGLAFCITPQALFGDETTGVWQPSLLAITTAIISIYAAFIIRFLMQYALSLLAFWVERVEKIDALIFMPYIFLSGTLAPLETFHEPVRQWVMLTPFPYTVWLPAMLLTDASRITTEILWQAVIVIGSWGSVFALLNMTLWRFGLKRFSAMGA